MFMQMRSPINQVYNAVALQKRQISAFTLVELLLVIVVIAILAAIAVPSLSNAQVRSKVASTKNALRTVAASFEAHRTDNHDYPTHDEGGYISYYRHLTSPIAYLTSADMVLDPFRVKFVYEMQWHDKYLRHAPYNLDGSESAELTWFRKPLAAYYGSWVLFSCGPSHDPDFYDVYTLSPIGTVNPNPKPRLLLYDPTNGVNSLGIIAWSQKLGLL